jgi:hypothetical protein
LAISAFIIGFALFLVIQEEKTRKRKVNESLIKAREAKALKALQNEPERISDTEKDLNELHNLIIENGTKKENIEG